MVVGLFLWQSTVILRDTLVFILGHFHPGPTGKQLFLLVHATVTGGTCDPRLHYGKVGLRCRSGITVIWTKKHYSWADKQIYMHTFQVAKYYTHSKKVHKTRTSLIDSKQMQRNKFMGCFLMFCFMPWSLLPALNGLHH